MNLLEKIMAEAERTEEYYGGGHVGERFALFVSKRVYDEICEDLRKEPYNMKPLDWYSFVEASFRVKEGGSLYMSLGGIRVLPAQSTGDGWAIVGTKIF